jgi:hypothetical protein
MVQTALEGLLHQIDALSPHIGSYPAGAIRAQPGCGGIAGNAAQATTKRRARSAVGNLPRVAIGTALIGGPVFALHPRLLRRLWASGELYQPIPQMV